MTLIELLAEQGITGEQAMELAERKRNHPNLCSVTIGGQYIRLTPKNGKKFNEMVESGVPPGANTDREFLEGLCNGNQFEHETEVGNAYRKECEKHGGSTLGRKYMPSLARFPGDPEAWVSGRGDLQRIVEKRGGSFEGTVNVKGRTDVPNERPEAVPVADKVVDQVMCEQLAGQTLTRREVMDYREKVKDKLTPSWKKNKLKKPKKKV